MLDRRSMIASALVGVLGCSGMTVQAGGDRHEDALRRIEERTGGRLGAFVLDPVTGNSIGWRPGERFAHCSSFKMSLAAMLLHKSDTGLVDLGERLRWTQADMLPVSPVTAGNLAAGLPVRDLAHATLVTSDNTAANVLLRRFGGPEELTRFWRSLGDAASRLDRFEPELNVTPPGTDLDTTTPEAMARTVATLVTGNLLSPQSRSTLRDWMNEVATGRDRVRAGFPSHWISGDKTGTGIGPARHTYVDLAFGGPAGEVPVIVAAYFEPRALVDPMDPVATGALAEVGRIAASWREQLRR